MTVAEDTDVHASESELAGLLDGDISEPDRLRVEAHLETCAQCRLELVEAGRVRESYRPGMARLPGRNLGIAAGLALAAGLAALLLVPGTRMRAPARPDAVRGSQVGAREDRLRIDAVQPPNDAVVSAAGITFAWRPAAADVYRLTLLDASGAPVWSTETADTTALLPRDAGLASAAYFWRVDAIADGIVATTGIRRLRVVP